VYCGPGGIVLCRSRDVEIAQADGGVYNTERRENKVYVGRWDIYTLVPMISWVNL